MNKIESGEYRHYKGGRYWVHGMAKHSETLEDMVSYQSLDSGNVWVRPLSKWLELTEDGEVRFERVGA